jgi:hypothetical protein
MAVKWLTEFLLLFQPEESSRFPDVKYSPMTPFRSEDEKPRVSAKARVWTVISIVVGLFIGQL